LEVVGMVVVEDMDVCPNCGEEYSYEVNCSTGEYRKMSMCKCDRELFDAEEFLKGRGLLEEFRRFHEEMEKEREAEKIEE
jgi:hypothetical protein